MQDAAEFDENVFPPVAARRFIRDEVRSDREENVLVEFRRVLHRPARLQHV